jgi:tripartite-type tricarboxylate transporter receptor subunit TctC
MRFGVLAGASTPNQALYVKSESPDSEKVVATQYVIALTVSLFAVVFAASGPAWSQKTGITKIVVPAPPGDANDVMTRLLAEQIERSLSRTFIVEDRPGANTTIGTEEVSRATPDGLTLLTNSPSAFTIIPHLRTLNYDPLTSFQPVWRACGG